MEKGDFSLMNTGHTVSGGVGSVISAMQRDVAYWSNVLFPWGSHSDAPTLSEEERMQQEDQQDIYEEQLSYLGIDAINVLLHDKNSTMTSVRLDTERVDSEMIHRLKAYWFQYFLREAAKLRDFHGDREVIRDHHLCLEIHDAFAQDDIILCMYLVPLQK